MPQLGGVSERKNSFSFGDVVGESNIDGANCSGGSSSSKRENLE